MCEWVQLKRVPHAKRVGALQINAKPILREAFRISTESTKRTMEKQVSKWCPDEDLGPECECKILR